jgi:hypothetical protein
MSSRKRLVAFVMTGMVVAVGSVLSVAGSGPEARADTSHVGLATTVSPITGGNHVRFTVRFTGRWATGVFGKLRRSYIVEAHAVRPAVACVNDRDWISPGRPAGTRMRATLDPARGDGGSSGWCRGVFRGTVTYYQGYACPAKGQCRPPTSFRSRTRLVARFSFRVR